MEHEEAPRRSDTVSRTLPQHRVGHLEIEVGRGGPPNNRLVETIDYGVRQTFPVGMPSCVTSVSHRKFGSPVQKSCLTPVLYTMLFIKEAPKVFDGAAVSKAKENRTEEGQRANHNKRS